MKKLISLIALFFLIVSQTASATPWAEKKTYGEKVTGKLAFGLKNTFFAWTEMFSEPKRYKFDLKKSEWEGFCMGISKFVFYTADGLIQLATFPIPVDFPDFGAGVLPDLGKKKEGPPKPWEVHGKSKYTVTPAAEVPVSQAEIPAPVMMKPALVPVTPTPVVVPAPTPDLPKPQPTSPVAVASVSAPAPQVPEPAPVTAPQTSGSEPASAESYSPYIK